MRSIISATEFDPDAFMRQAERLTGLADWGGMQFVDGLDAFCATVRGEKGVTSSARQEVRATVLRLLTQRLDLYRDRSTYPEIAAQEIRRPLFITGLPRSGSTLLHGLLAADPRARSISTWEHEEISPPARAETFETDPRIARTQARIDGRPPEMLPIHAVGARLPDECNFITSLAFQSINLHSRFYRTPYVDWYLGADDAPAFEVHMHALQHMQAFCSREWWVLKSPPHMFHLPRILATYPDARIIFLHRDPAETLPSIASLFSVGKQKTYGTVDRHRVGREALSWWTSGLERALAFRAAGHEAQIYDLHYQALLESPLEAVSDIYAWLGVDMRPAAGGMEAFLQEHPKGKHGPHLYSAEQYGFEPASLRRSFSEYIDAFGIPTA